MAGGEFNFVENSVYPIKTYEAFEADPMEVFFLHIVMFEKMKKWFYKY